LRLGSLQHFLKLRIGKHIDFHLADIGKRLSEEGGRSYDKKEKDKE
jgi:hypothetical protein